MNKKIVAVAILTTALQGCASTVLRPTSEANRDIQGAYDGVWRGVVVNTPASQSGPGNWVMSCGDMTGKSIGKITVSDGVAKLSNTPDSAKTYVNKAGKFRFNIPMDTIAAASGTSDSSISNGKMTYILFGSLESQKGSLTYGIAELSNSGCTSKIKFARI